MIINEKEKEILLNKRLDLSNIKIILKKEFIGIDYIIDEILDLIEPWYLFQTKKDLLL